MGETLPTKITPSIAELCAVNNSLPCPECSATFSSSANRDLHLVKRHKLGSLPKPIASVQFHCPAAGCIYAIERHFAKRKYVKQHYLKVHAAKTFACDRCKGGFSTASALKRHAGICGRQFHCRCSLSFNSPEALATHTLRAGHRKFEYHNDNSAKEVRTLPPAPVILAAVALSELSFRPRRDTAAQTEVRERGVPMSAQTESPRQRGAATQTARRISATTQTPPCGQRPIAPKDGQGCEAGVTSRLTQTSRSPPAARKRKSAQTQTNAPSKLRRQAISLGPTNRGQALTQATPLRSNPAKHNAALPLTTPLIPTLANHNPVLPPASPLSLGLTDIDVATETTPIGSDPTNHDAALPLATPLDPGPANPSPSLSPAANEVESLFSEGGADLLDALWAGQLDCQTQTEPEPSLLEQLLDCETQTEAGDSDSLDGLYCHSTTQTCDHFLFPELGCCHDTHTQTDTR